MIGHHSLYIPVPLIGKRADKTTFGFSASLYIAVIRATKRGRYPLIEIQMSEQIKGYTGPGRR